MKKLIIFLMLIALSPSAYSAEIIVGFEDKDKVILNEELRTMRKDSERIDTRVDTLETMETTWEDYSATSTVTGWSSLDNKQIYTKKIGKTVFVAYDFQGTSNATGATFTLPYTSSNTINLRASLPYVFDNGAVVTTPGEITLLKNSATVTLNKTIGIAASWTNSGGKRAIGQFCYESA